MRIGVSLPSRLGDGAPGGGLSQRDLIDLAVLAEAGATDVMVGLLSADPKRLMHRITESLLPLITGD